MRAKAVWEAVSLTSVSDFIPSEKKAFKKWRQAGGEVSDATRIEGVKARFGLKLDAAYKQHVQNEACAGRRDGRLEKEWGRFCKVMERCGKAVGPEAAGAAPAAAAPEGMNTTAAAAAGQDECWQHSHVGTCSYGDKCRFPHVGEAGSKRDSVCDEQGNCRKYMKHGDCFRLERGKCPFLHVVTSRTDGSLSAEQHAAIMAYAEANSLDATAVSWSTVRADGEGKWIKKANEMADAVSKKPRVFPVLEPRKKKASGGMSYKEALGSDGSDSE
jgi:hypothetical protein